MPAGWKKNAPKSCVSNYEQCGGSRHHKKLNGNSSSKKTCRESDRDNVLKLCRNDKSINKQKGCQKAHDKTNIFYHEYEELEHEGGDCYPATWTTRMGHLPAVPVSTNATTVELYDKMLSDYISDELLTKSRTKVKASDASSSESEAGSGSEDNDDDICDDWEMVSVESVLSV